MKIKVTQLDQTTRSTIALALDLYTRNVHKAFPDLKEKYMNMAQAICHGELLLCEYVYPEQEEGGHYGE